TGIMRQNGATPGYAGQATAPPPPSTTATATTPEPPRAGKRADLILQAVIALALLASVAIVAFAILPALSTERVSIGLERREQRAREEEQRRWDRLLTDAREQAKKLTAENLRLAMELNKALNREK